MSHQDSVWSTVTGVWSDCRDRWRPLLVAGLGCRLASALLLPAVYAVLLRLAIAGSGQAVLTDLDLLYFVTSLIGVSGLSVMGIATMAIIALETGTFLTILSQPADRAIFSDALRYTLGRTSRLFGIATRAVIETALWLAPAIAVAAAAYAWLLSDFDINYYLSERPPSFWLAGAIAVTLLIYVLVVGMKLATDWFLALPVALFEETELSQVRHLCRERTAKGRWVVRGWIAAWMGGTLLLSSTSTLLVGTAIWFIGPYWPRSLTAVAAGIGLGLAALVLTSMAVNFGSSVALAALLRRLYLRLGGTGSYQASIEKVVRQRLAWLTTPRLAAGVALAILGTTTLGFVAMNSVSIEDEVLVIGHRGSPRSAPGNTLASVRAAIDEGADWVEIDVQETADGEVIVFHDSDLMKAAGVDLKIWDATAERLSSIDLAGRFAPEFTGERIPTLDQVLAECRGKVGVVVELKEYGHGVALEERVIEIVERLEMVDQTIFMSLDRAAVDKLRSLRPDWRVGQLLSVVVGKTSQLQVDFLAVNASFASRGFVRASHRAGRDVYVWTVDDPVAISSMISRGVDGVITDLPAVARSVLAERAGMPPVTRLLVDLADRYRIASLFQAKLPIEDP